MFDQPQPSRTSASRTVSSPATSSSAAATSTAFGSLDDRRRSSHAITTDSTSPGLQNQRVSQLIQATGHPTISTAFTNRFLSSSSQNQNNQQFYASFSAPSSTVAVNQQQNRPSRPPVPLFTHGIGSQQAPAKMDLHDALNLEDFPGLDGAATGFSSPAVPVYDMNASASSSTNMGTVSPQDLLRDFTSAPNSTAFTNLTSPSLYNGSPDFTDSYDVSPAFDNGDFGGSTDTWFPLFPQENTVTATAPAVDNSPAQDSDELDVVEKPRRKSGNSPSSGGHGRHSSVSGVNSRRRDKPLPPIIIDDPSDTIAMKRARNTLAARKSRERKAQRLEDLEEKIMKLEQERDHWKKLAMGRTGGSA